MSVGWSDFSISFRAINILLCAAERRLLVATCTKKEASADKKLLICATHAPSQAHFRGAYNADNIAQSTDILVKTSFVDVDQNWFSAPPGHLWYWQLDEEMSPLPLKLGEEYFTKPVVIPAPTCHREAMEYVQVLEMMSDGKYGWRGESMSDFREYTELSDEDYFAWDDWVRGDTIIQFLDAVITKAKHLAEVSAKAQGYVVMRGG